MAELSIENRRSSLLLEGSELPEKIKAYIEEHKLESILTKAFNDVIRILPIDPYSEICSILKDENKPIFSINSIKIKDQIIEDFKSIPSLELIMTYKGATRTVLTYPVPFSTLAYEKYTASNDELLNVFNEIFSEEVKSLDYEDPNQFDEKILTLLKNKNKENKETDAMALSLSNTISLMIYISTALMTNINFCQFIAENKSNLILKKAQRNQGKTPNLGFCIFKTGKSMNSKIKYERFLLMVNSEIFESNNDLKQKKKEIIIELYKKMFEIIKKTLTAGKAGENGMRTNNEGSFTPPSDKYEDVLKLMEGFIKEINASMNNQNFVSLGIDFNAENFFNSKDGTYEPEGVKKAVDSNALIDIYLKLINDHPSLTYLEQPLAYDDIDGWGTLLEKLKDKTNISIVQKVDIYRKEPEPKIPTPEQMNELNKEKKEEPKKEEPKEKPPEKPKKGKKKKKPVETVKTEEVANKTNENFKKEKPKIGMFSYRLGEANVISQLFNNILKKKETNADFSGVIYENDIEANQAGIIQLGMALNFDYIILNGLNMSAQKITKIKAYVEELDNVANLKNIPENNEVNDVKKDNDVNKNNTEVKNLENQTNKENVDKNVKVENNQS